MTDEDKELMFRAYQGLLVLRTVLDRKGLLVGEQTTATLLRDIANAHPEFPSRVTLRRITDND